MLRIPCSSSSSSSSSSSRAVAAAQASFRPKAVQARDLVPTAGRMAEKLAEHLVCSLMQNKKNLALQHRSGVADAT